MRKGSVWLRAVFVGRPTEKVSEIAFAARGYASSVVKVSGGLVFLNRPSSLALVFQ
jgi:hypothetical protein